ncbi:MAG: tRNA pseudouridine(13) synthase TruD [Caldilinea sp.]|nr:tRNA pseudouridine(13) synthase TruD [Caldilinea sp.]MDW8442254.1 tRNA pseudouridine(13) synthase TruD [Caldilineaceae bacterium]
MNLALPYLTAHLPGVGGRLRAEADHFVVEEIALYEACGEGQHLYVNLTKSGLTTKEVQIRLEQLFGLARGAVGFAGLKDKFARTTQTFSLNVGYRPAAFIDEAVRRIEAELPVRVNWAQFHRNKLRPGHLLANRFEITVTDLAVTIDEAIVRSQAIAAEIRRRGLPNFFGVQRFGQKGANAHQGLDLLLKRRSIRDRWLRRFLISSYQSHLCNCYLVRRLEIGAFERLLPGDVAKKTATGGMFDVEDVEQEQPRYVAQEINFTAPIYGARMWQAKAEAGALERQILASSSVTLMHFEEAHIEGSRRVGRLLAPDLTVDVAEGKLIARFTLPKGAYATIIMRELMKVDDDHFSTVNEEDENLE